MLSMTVDDAKLIAKRCDEKIFEDSSFWTLERIEFASFYRATLEFFNNSDLSGHSNLVYNHLAKFYKAIFMPQAEALDRVPLRNHFDCTATKEFQLEAPPQLELYWLFMNQFERYIKSHFDELKQRDLLLHQSDFQDYKFTQEDHVWPVLFAAEAFAKFWVLSPFFNGNRFIGIMLANFALVSAGYPSIQIFPSDELKLKNIFTSYLRDENSEPLYTFFLERVLSSLNYMYEKL